MSWAAARWSGSMHHLASTRELYGISEGRVVMGATNRKLHVWLGQDNHLFQDSTQQGRGADYVKVNSSYDDSL